MPPPQRTEDAGGTTESTGMQFTASQSQLMLNLLRSHIPALHHMPPNDLQFIVPCAGMQLKLPDGRQPFSAHYPFMLHGGDRRQHRKPLWSMPNEDGVVFARTCAQFVMSMQSCDSTAPITPVSCESCLLLNTEGDVRSLSAEAKLLRIVLHNACDDSYFQVNGVQDTSLSFHQLQQRKTHQIQQRSMSRLMGWKASKKMTRLLQVQSNTEKILQLLSQKDLPRVHTVLNRMLRKGASSAMILRVLTQVFEGMHVPKSFTDDRRAVLLAKLSLILGGPRCLHALKACHGLPSRRTVNRLVDNTCKFVVSPGAEIQGDIVLHNLLKFALNPRHKDTFVPRLQCLMIDDLNLNAGLQVSSSTFKMLGFWREGNFGGISLDVDSYAKFQAMKTALDAGNLVLAQEMTVYGIAPNSEKDYHIHLVAAHGTARKGSSHESIRGSIQTILQEWSEHAKTSHGDIFTIAKDGK